MTNNTEQTVANPAYTKSIQHINGVKWDILGVYLTYTEAERWCNKVDDTDLDRKIQYMSSTGQYIVKTRNISDRNTHSHL